MTDIDLHKESPWVDSDKTTGSGRTPAGIWWQTAEATDVNDTTWYFIAVADPDAYDPNRETLEYNGIESRKFPEHEKEQFDAMVKAYITDDQYRELRFSGEFD